MEWKYELQFNVHFIRIVYFRLLILRKDLVRWQYLVALTQWFLYMDAIDEKARFPKHNARSTFFHRSFFQKKNRNPHQLRAI